MKTLDIDFISYYFPCIAINAVVCTNFFSYEEIWTLINADDMTPLVYRLTSLSDQNTRLSLFYLKGFFPKYCPSICKYKMQQLYKPENQA